MQHTTIRVIFLIIYLLIFQSLIMLAQDSLEEIEKIREEKEFIAYLSQKGLYKEALLAYNQLPANFSNKGLRDSLYYYAGWSSYNLKDLDESAELLKKVSRGSVFFPKSHFFSGYNYMHLGKYEIARAQLEGNNWDKKLNQELKHFELAGIALLEKDFQAYQSHSLHFDYNHYALRNEELLFDSLYQNMINFKPKSMVLAGVMSSFLPGSGKVYAGKLGGGITTFLVTSILGAITAENYLKAGPTNYKTIIFGSLFTIFYIGNIYGSVFSIKLYREEFYLTHEHKILFNLHIPLRRVFN